jgi:hypothetical protein
MPCVVIVTQFLQVHGGYFFSLDVQSVLGNGEDIYHGPDYITTTRICNRTADMEMNLMVIVMAFTAFQIDEVFSESIYQPIFLMYVTRPCYAVSMSQSFRLPQPLRRVFQDISDQNLDLDSCLVIIV